MQKEKIKLLIKRCLFLFLLERHPRRTLLNQIIEYGHSISKHFKLHCVKNHISTIQNTLSSSYNNQKISSKRDDSDMTKVKRVHRNRSRYVGWINSLQIKYIFISTPIRFDVNVIIFLYLKTKISNSIFMSIKLFGNQDGIFRFIFVKKAIALCSGC